MFLVSTRSPYCAAMEGRSGSVQADVHQHARLLRETFRGATVRSVTMGVGWVGPIVRMIYPGQGSVAPGKPAKRAANTGVSRDHRGPGPWVGEEVAIAGAAVHQRIASRWCGCLARSAALAGAADLWGMGYAHLVQEIAGRPSMPHRAWSAGTDRTREGSREMCGGTDRSVVAFHPSLFLNEESRGHTSADSPAA
jgi:hypothetical protein